MERSARRRKPSKSVEQLKAEINARDEAKAQRAVERKAAQKPLTPAERHEQEKAKRASGGTSGGFSQYRMTGSRGHGSEYQNIRSVREEVLVDYLLDEGFASDEKSAQAIIGAMSEEWKQSIVEGTAAIRADVPQPGTKTVRMTATGKEPAGDRLVRQAGQAIGNFLGSRGVVKSEPAPPERKPLISTQKKGPENNFGRGF